MAFGRQGLWLTLPDAAGWQVLEPRWAAPVDDPRAAIEEALDHPVAGPPLEQLARGRASAAISVCDITRPAPNSVTLPPVLQRLERAGIGSESITILIPSGNAR